MLQKRHLRLGGRLLLVFGRHFARIHRVEHLLPAFGGGHLRDGKRHVIQSHARLGFLVSVAFETVLLKKGAVRLVYAHLMHFGKSRGAQKPQQKSDPFHAWLL